MIRWLTVAFYFLSSTSGYAQIVNPMGKERYSSGNEYFVGAELGRPLITINLISGVRNPGVYHVPVGTNMAELFSYSGGTAPTSDLENVIVRSGLSSKASSTKVYDFQSLLEKNDQMPLLIDRDVVHIQQNLGLDMTLKWMSLATMAVSILSAIVVIEDRKSD